MEGKVRERKKNITLQSGLRREWKQVRKIRSDVYSFGAVSHQSHSQFPF